MKLTYTFALIAILLTSCENKSTLWSTSKFSSTLTDKIDSFEFKIIYSSRGPDVSENFDDPVGTYTTSSDKDFTPFKITDYYVHYVVLALASNDTLNILSPEAIQIAQKDIDKTFFFTANMESNKKLLYSMKKVTVLKTFNPNDFTIPTRDSVARAPEFDHIAENKFKTVIGFIQRKKTSSISRK